MIKTITIILISVIAIFLVVSCSQKKSTNKENLLTYEQLSKYAFETFTLSNGMNVNYRVQGKVNKTTILLIHGGGDSHNVWNQWADILKEKYRIIRIDMPGHGLTDPYKDKKYSSKKFGDFIKLFVDEFGIEEFVLAGHSYGGEASLHYTSQNPNKVKALCLVSSGAYKPKWEDVKEYLESFNQEFPEGKEGTRKMLEIFFHDKTAITDELVTTFYELSRYDKNQGVFEALENGSMKKYQEVENIKSIQIPTLLLWGEYDKISSLKNIGKRLDRELPNSKLIIYKNTGHMPNYSKAKETATDFSNFLKAKYIN